MIHLHRSTSLILSSFWLVLSLFSLSAGAVNPPDYGGAGSGSNGYLNLQPTTPLASNNSSSRVINITITTVSTGRYRLTGTLVDPNGQPACGLALASGRCVFTCGPGSPRCEGGTDSLAFGQFDLTDLPTEVNGTINLQTFVAGSMPGLEVVKPSDGCSYTIAPPSQAFEYLGGTGTVTVSTPDGCAWTAQSHGDWIAITSGTSGTGPGTTTYTVSTNASNAKRTGTLTIAGKTHTVSQNPKGSDPID